MKPNFTEEEARTPVTFGELAILIEEIFNTVAANKEIEDDMFNELLDKIMDPLLERVREIEYRQARDTRFLMRVFCDLSLASPSNLEAHYVKWCERFDKLNKKEKQDESKVNC